MPKKTKFGFGSSSNVEQAVNSGKINARDVVFLDENTDCPKVGWVTLDGKIVVSKPDLSEVNAELATKADAEEVRIELEAKANASDVESLGSQIAEKANVTDVAELEKEIAEKVDVAVVKSMIDEAGAAAIEVIEF